MQIKRNERGRSMVEILGVLALIGLLSIGGIAGYQYAYSSYQAGQIQDVIGKAKLLATQNNRSSHVKEVRRFVENMLSKYKPADTTPMVTHRDGKYIVDLFKVSDSICEKLQNRREIFNSMQIGMIPEACTTDEMSMQFTFDSIVIGGSAVNGSGDSYDNPIERCPDKQVWRQKEDGTYGCVCRHAYEYGEDCTRCEPPRSWNQGNQSCQCPADKPIWEYGVCKCIADTDCQYSGTGFCCDDTEQVCRQCDETDCDKTKGLTLADGRCVCSGRKEWRQDEGDSEPSCKCPINTPAEANPETCECPDGKDNVDEDGDGMNECVISCPSDTGFTGLRNRTTGNCLCDTGAGYKTESEMVGGVQTCVCDESRDYYQGPSGCVQCYQTTKAVCNQYYSGGNVDCDTIDELKWYCGFRKATPNGYLVFNPFENKYCLLHQVLIKEDIGFKCGYCDDYIVNQGSRATYVGICACRFGEKLVGKKCVSQCSSGQVYYKYINKCLSCVPSNVYDNSGICHTSNICTNEKNGGYFWYRWRTAVAGKCSQNFPNYTTNKTDPCSYTHGCKVNQSSLAYCDLNTKITENCQCSTGGNVGQYCCSASTYPTSTGCVSCPAGQVPNSTRTGCESCPKNKITQNGKCVKCDKGYYPSSQQNRCLACPADRTTDEDGLTCSVCVDSLKVFNMITNKCECKNGYEENPVNGSCILFEDEILEEETDE
ncbi:MAG: hypothetical protein IKZ02_04835 [Alphaproteobacteria bacterium]|nr:hypothetical protein [Alphaproteobacteria bacterium]